MKVTVSARTRAAEDAALGCQVTPPLLGCGTTPPALTSCAPGAPEALVYRDAAGSAPAGRTHRSTGPISPRS